MQRIALTNRDIEFTQNRSKFQGVDLKKDFHCLFAPLVKMISSPIYCKPSYSFLASILSQEDHGSQCKIYLTSETIFKIFLLVNEYLGLHSFEAGAIMPASNAMPEHSISALRRVKTYLRNTMLKQQLNRLMIPHVHKEHTDPNGTSN